MHLSSVRYTPHTNRHRYRYRQHGLPLLAPEGTSAPSIHQKVLLCQVSAQFLTTHCGVTASRSIGDPAQSEPKMGFLNTLQSGQPARAQPRALHVCAAPSVLVVQIVKGVNGSSVYSAYRGTYRRPSRGVAEAESQPRKRPEQRTDHPVRERRLLPMSCCYNPYHVQDTRHTAHHDTTTSFI